MTLKEEIFKNHYQYYKNLGIETIKQQSGQVEQVSSDYQGRVIYELLQNAFDKADKNILVEVKGNCLYIANDGTRFTYNADHDYKEGISYNDKFTRYDFQSLCSISTSSKNTAESIGNKGVGFKSVFSVAKDGFVNVYTEGILVNGSERIKERISFGIYDSFKDIYTIPEDFNQELKKSIEKQLRQVQQERKERGVPGYYYPLHITEEPLQILDYFAKGFVTVIEIPFDRLDKITPLFDEIKKIHFNFVSLKYDKPFQIDFKLNGSPFQKKIETNNGLFFSTSIKKDAIEQLAKDAGVQIGDNNKIAICFKSREEIARDKKGLFYNYLPTKQKSPFKYVDFHADFHTSVDRKSIEFDDKSKIGKYNAALLKACIELYINTVISYIDDDKGISLTTETIQIKDNQSLSDFLWTWIEIGDAYQSFNIVRTVLKIWNYRQDNYSYQFASDVLAFLAHKYFSNNRSIKEHELFFRNVLDFIEYYARDYSQQYVWNNRFKEQFAQKILSSNAQILPNTKLKQNRKLLYKDRDDGINLPDFLGVNIFSFKIKDDFLESQLGIEKYSDSNVLYRYFRQVSISGEVRKEKITESEQIELLKSLFVIFERKTEPVSSLAHRYLYFLKDDEKGKYSPQNTSNFSVSTVFLKTKTGHYFPAQLCSKQELDESFLCAVCPDSNIDEFLLFLGVSPFKNYKIVDGNIYEKIKQGLDYIPAPDLWSEKEKLRKGTMIPAIKIITPSKEIHPALINFNHYRFLEDISNPQFSKQLTPLKVGEYNEFPSEYRQVLWEVIEKELIINPQGVFRLYSTNLFHLFHRVGKYLVVNQGNYYWSNNTEFKIARNRSDFELLKTQPIPVLCFFNGKEIPEFLAQNKIELKPYNVELNNEKDISSEFKMKYEKYIPFILLEISYLGNHISKRDYIKELSEVSKFQKSWSNLKIKSGDKLTALYLYDEEAEPIPIYQKTCYFEETTTLYFDNTISKNEKAAAIASHIFNIGSLESKIELMFFHKEIEDLSQEYNYQDIELINSKWLPDYDNKFKSFQHDILTHFKLTQYSNTAWYIYSESNRGDVLVKLNREGRINELKQVVNNCKQREEYQEYFENFQIKIDRSHIENKISQLLLAIAKVENDQHKVEELKHLSSQLGVEERLYELELEIKAQYPENNKDGLLNKDVVEKRKEIALRNKVQNIFDKISYLKQKKVTNTDLSGGHSCQKLPVKAKKIILKGQSLPDSKVLETMGASGEEEVLLYFINEFVSIKDIQKRQRAIELVYMLLRKKIGDDSHEKYKSACLDVVDDDLALQKALIPFFYVTMHHKFSFFDLIVFYEDKPTLVEVKTTKRNNSFYLSIAEVEVARGDDNYIIVRNTAEYIDILGNPIKDIENDMSYVQGDNFILKPRNYQFELKKI